MEKIDHIIIDIITHYAKELNVKKVVSILEKKAVESEEEAKALLDFWDPMCEQVKIDEKNKVEVIRGEAIHHTDIVKCIITIENYLEDNGYEYLIDDE